MSHPNKPRLRWTVELHERFVDAVTQLGGPDKAKPKNIHRVMAVEGLTLDHIRSHLQQYRLGKQPRNYFNDHSKNLQQFNLGKQPHKEFKDHSMKEGSPAPTLEKVLPYCYPAVVLRWRLGTVSPMSPSATHVAESVSWNRVRQSYSITSK